MSDTKCPIRGCAGSKADFHLTCARHWRMVPKGVQTRVYALYANELGSDKQRKLCFDLLHILNEGVGPKTVWP